MFLSFRFHKKEPRDSVFSSRKHEKNGPGKGSSKLVSFLEFVEVELNLRGDSEISLKHWGNHKVMNTSTTTGINVFFSPSKLHVWY